MMFSTVLERLGFRQRWRLFFLAAIVGLLLVFFYLQHAALSFEAVDRVVLFSSDDEGDYGVSGWTPAKRLGGRDAIAANGKESEISLYLPQIDDHILTMFILPSFSSPEQQISVSVNDAEVGAWNLRPVTQWQALSLTVPADAIKAGSNRVRLSYVDKDRTKQIAEPYAAELIGLRNFRAASRSVIKSATGMNLPMPQVILLFDNSSALSRYWQGWPDLRSLLRSFMLLLAFGLVWSFSSLVLRGLGGLDDERALRYALLANTPGIAVFAFLWLVSLVTPYHIYYPFGSFVVLSLGLPLVFSTLTAVAAYLLTRSNGLAHETSNLFSQARVFKPSQTFICVFIGLMLVSAILSIAGLVVYAQGTASWAYLALVVGVVLKLIEVSRKDKRRL